jgi:hypothetical protein
MGGDRPGDPQNRYKFSLLKGNPIPVRGLDPHPGWRIPVLLFLESR